jgi:hypothetical protein
VTTAVTSNVAPDLSAIRPLDLRSEAEFASALKSDTRMLQALGLTDELEIEDGLFSS